MNRTWNLTLTATDEHPELTLKGVEHTDALKIVRGLMSGPSSPDYAVVNAARAAQLKVAAARTPVAA
jgi:hypothetical protein